MKIPPHLKEGDTVGIVATAKKVSPEEIIPAAEKLKEWGLKVVYGENLFNTYHQFAGTDEQRALDFQEMLDEPSVKAVLLARGGYGTVKIIDKIDFSSFQQQPKWILGFSDATVLHAHIEKHYNIATAHTAMAFHFPGDGSENIRTETMRKILFGEDLTYSVSSHPLNRTGSSEGILTGGNLSIICNPSGTDSQPDTKGKILFLEDLDEYLYHMDRMMMNLKRSGILKGLKGLIVGGLTDMKDNKIPFGMTAEEIIADAVKEYDFPVCFGFPAGHIEENQAIMLGRTVRLDVGEEKSTLRYV